MDRKYLKWLSHWTKKSTLEQSGWNASVLQKICNKVVGFVSNHVFRSDLVKLILIVAQLTANTNHISIISAHIRESSLDYLTTWELFSVFLSFLVSLCILSYIFAGYFIHSISFLHFFFSFFLRLYLSRYLDLSRLQNCPT